MIPKILQRDYGSTSTFHSVNTNKKSETGSHLSLGFGVGVGLPYLCSGSVKGTYDEDVKNNNDVSGLTGGGGGTTHKDKLSGLQKKKADKSSIRASVRCATAQLERNPRLSHEAMVMLKYDGGYTAFTEKYGDYFVWGYRLGGDTGLLLSSSSFSSRQVESYGIEATLEVLDIEVGKKTWARDFRTFSAGKAMRLLGYDTLSDGHWNVTTAEDGGMAALVERMDGATRDAHDLWTRAWAALEAQGLEDGDELTHEQCEFLTGSGLAVELVLLPMSALRDVARWTTERDVI